MSFEILKMIIFLWISFTFTYDKWTLVYVIKT